MKGERERGGTRSEPTPQKIRIRASSAPARSRCHRREASSPTMTLASHPGAARHPPRRRRQRPPPLHHRRRRSCQEGAGSGRGRRAPGRPEPGTEDLGPTAATVAAAVAARRQRQRGRSVPGLIHQEQQVGAASPGGCPAAALLGPALGDLPLRHWRQEERVCHRLAGLRATSAILREEERVVGVREEG